MPSEKFEDIKFKKKKGKRTNKKLIIFLFNYKWISLILPSLFNSKQNLIKYIFIKANSEEKVNTFSY